MVNVNAACSGGIIATCVLGHLAAIGEQERVAAFTMMVCALDQARMGTAGAFASRELAAAAVAESARKGYIDGRVLEGVFAWLRPNDLVWNYFVNNCLLGKDPPAFDILYWNPDRRARRVSVLGGDATRSRAARHVRVQRRERCAAPPSPGAPGKHGGPRRPIADCRGRRDFATGLVEEDVGL